MECRVQEVRTQARKAFRIAVLAMVAISATQPARADVVFSLDTLINGDAPTKVNNALPALVATISSPAAQAVNFHLDTNNLLEQEFVGVWLFNMDMSGGLDPLSIFVGGPGLTNPPVGGVTIDGTQTLNGGNQVKGGLFNVLFSFVTGGGPTNRFHGGMTLDITLTNAGAGTLNENSFLVFSAPDGNVPGGWYSAADLQGIPAGREGGTTSGSIGTRTTDTPDTVPEPGSMVLLSIGGIAVLRRKLGSCGSVVP
jgi:PEP-CTERM motif-containing protein